MQAYGPVFGVPGAQLPSPLMVSSPEPPRMTIGAAKAVDRVVTAEAN